jgi:hypothetical protein
MRAAMIRSGLYLELKHSAISTQWCSFRIARYSSGTPECGSRTVDSRLGDLARSQNSSRLHGRFPLPIDHRRSLLRESTDAISYWQEQTMGIDGGRTIDCEL